MKISIEQAMSILQNKVEEFIFKEMRESQISAGVMKKILESILCEIRKLKCQDLEKLIIKLNEEIPEICDETIEKHETKGENEDGSLQSSS